MATFTITTPIDIDSLTAKVGGDTYNINGGELTIAQDSRVGLNQNVNASLGNITISSTLGGKVIIDASLVREIAFSGGSGVVPAYNTIISQGSASGKLIAVYTSIASTPLSAGGAMPSTGFIKIKQWNEISFSSGTLSGITATATGVDVQGWLEIVMQDTKTTTVPRLGSFEINKNKELWYKIGVTNGTVGQIIQAPTFGGNTASHLPAVWIEDGLGGKEPYPAMYVNFSNSNVSTDIRGKVVQALADGSFRIGSDGTNNVGYVPPSGRNIYIPAVILRGCSTTVNNVNILPNTTLANRPDFTTTAAGNIEINSTIGSWYFSFASAYQLKMNYNATFESYYIQNNAKPFILNNLVNGLSMVGTAASYPLNLQVNSFGGDIDNCRMIRSETVTNSYILYMTGNYDVTVSNSKFENINSTRVASAYSYVNQCGNITFNNIELVGHPFYISASQNIKVKGVDFCNQSVGNTPTTIPIYAIMIGTSSSNIEVANMTLGKNNVIDDQQPYNGLVTASYSSNIFLHDFGTFASPMLGGTANQMAYHFADGGNTTDIKLYRSYVTANRTRQYSCSNTSKNMIIQNISGNIGSELTTGNNTLVRGIRSQSSSATAQSSVYGSHYFDMFTSDTAGVVWLAMNEPTSETLPYVTSTFGTGAGFTSAGTVSMPNIGDQVIWEMPYYTLGHIGFTSMSLTGTNTGNFLFEYDIDKGNGFSGTYKTLSNANLIAEGAINPIVGCKFKIIATTTVANVTNALTYIRILTTSTLNDQRNAIYPDSYTTIEGCPTNDKIVAYLYDVNDNNPDNNTQLGYLVGSGKLDFKGGIYVGQYIYYIRWTWDSTTSSWVRVMSTRSNKQPIILGNNGNIKVYSGDEIQVASDIADNVSSIKQLVDLYLDAKVSSISGGGGSSIDEPTFHSYLDTYPNKNDWKANNVDLSSVTNAIAALHDISIADIEASTVLGKEATLVAIANAVAQIPTTDSVADIAPILTAISNLNDVTPAEVRAAFNAADFKDKNTELEIHTWLDSYVNKDDWKSSSVDLTAVTDAIGNLNDISAQEVWDISSRTITGGMIDGTNTKGYVNGGMIVRPQ